MLMALTGTPEQEKEYIFEMPLQHGLSYRFINYRSPSLFKTLSECFPYFEKSILHSKCSDIFNATDIVKRVTKGTSDLWVSCDKDENIKGCFVIGFAAFPQSTGIIAECISGEFHFENRLPEVEEYYRDLGYEFFEMTGRKGWEKVMGKMGYEFKSIILRKAL
jgi:hypothetical protein